MTRPVAFLCSALVAVSALTAHGLVQDPPVFRGAAETVRVFVTVTDKDDRLVPSLTRENFEVRDNGKAQPLTLFDNSPQPIRLIVMLDVSGSMAGNLSLLRAASEQLFARLRPDDLARVGTFGEDIAISPTFTRDTGALMGALPMAINPNAPTPLWRAVDQAMDSFEDEGGRRVVLVLSDGRDGGVRRFGDRYVGQLEIVDRARREDVMIYAVGLRSRMAPGARLPMPGPGADLGAMLAADLPDPGLGTAAIDTGGGYVEIRPRQDLAAAFTRVADELHSQYLLGFEPPARDGKSHRIEVKLDVRDLKARARKSYQAPKRPE